MTASSTSSEPERLYYVDWLRVLAMGVIFLYHSNRAFDFNGWHIKNAELGLGSAILQEGVNQFIMPLFFVFSGAAVFYSLKRRTARGFIGERTLRIAVPWVVLGMFVLGPPQVYLERIFNHQFSGSFLAFLPHYFDGLYGFGGNFAWMGIHLWYLMQLFLLSLIALPLFVAFRPGNSRPLLRAGKALENPVVLLLLSLPLGLAALATDALDMGSIRDMGSWDIFSYLLFFVYGYLVFSRPQIQATVERHKLKFLIVAVVLTGVYLFFRFQTNVEAGGQPPMIYFIWSYALRGFCGWCWVMAIVGFGRRCLNFNSSRLSYANEAVLPFHILHQAIILAIGFFVIQPGLGILPKYLIIAATSFVGIMATYELLVRRVDALRILFGMKARRVQLKADS